MSVQAVAAATRSPDASEEMPLPAASGHLHEVRGCSRARGRREGGRVVRAHTLLCVRELLSRHALRRAVVVDPPPRPHALDASERTAPTSNVAPGVCRGTGEHIQTPDHDSRAVLEKKNDVSETVNHRPMARAVRPIPPPCRCWAAGRRRRRRRRRHHRRPCRGRPCRAPPERRAALWPLRRRRDARR